MKFDLWTILFQIINFIVLLFILKKLLYRPIRDIMQKRRAVVEQTIRDAEAEKGAALGLKKKYEEEIDGLDEIKRRLTEKMKLEVKKEKEKLLREARGKADGMLEKEKAVLEKERKEFEAELHGTAVEAVSAFASDLLGGLADEDLHRRLFAKLIGEAESMASHIESAGRGRDGVALEVTSAYPLSGEEEALLKKEVESRVSKNIALETSVDSALIAGARVRVLEMAYDSSLSGQIEALKRRLAEGA